METIKLVYPVEGGDLASQTASVRAQRVLLLLLSQRRLTFLGSARNSGEGWAEEFSVLFSSYIYSISCITVTNKGEACVHLTLWIIKEKYFM